MSLSNIFNQSTWLDLFNSAVMDRVASISSEIDVEKYSAQLDVVEEFETFYSAVKRNPHVLVNTEEMTIVENDATRRMPLTNINVELFVGVSNLQSPQKQKEQAYRLALYIFKELSGEIIDPVTDNVSRAILDPIELVTYRNIKGLCVVTVTFDARINVDLSYVQ